MLYVKIKVIEKLNGYLSLRNRKVSKEMGDAISEGVFVIKDSGESARHALWRERVGLMAAMSLN